MTDCHCCHQPASISIMLSCDGHGRFYIPCQHVRDQPAQGPARAFWFCHRCMRAIEDSLRATIIRLMPVPPPDERPPAWDDMSGIERALFVHRWRVGKGYAPKPVDPDETLLHAGFRVQHT